MPVEIGQLIEGKYRIVRLIGEGGMGAVYEGENVRIGRRVAIKVLHAALTGSKEVVERFQREAQAAGRIGSDHILEVIDLGELPDGDHFMVMEYLEGEPLGARIERLGRMTPAAVAPLAKQLLRGLGAAHRAGIIHRDLKPDNVFILREKAGQADFVKIIDFGISKFQQWGGERMKMTRTGTVMGTPYYMSPEQASGSREADNRSDLYAVGVILYEAVTGRVPFQATSFNQLMFKIVLAEVPPPQSLAPEVDPGFAALILKAMARDPNHRFQTAEEFIAAIEAWEAGEAKISIPPPHAAGLLPQTEQVEVGPPVGAELPEGKRATAGSWTAPEPDAELAELPRKRSGPLLAAAVFLGFLVLGGGGTLAYVLLVDKSTKALPAASPLEPVASANSEYSTRSWSETLPPPSVAHSVEPAPSSALVPSAGASSGPVPSIRLPHRAARSTGPDQHKISHPRTLPPASHQPTSRGRTSTDFGY